MNDTDLEERVTFLEFQMVNVNEELVTLTEDLIDVENGVENVEGQFTVILADQVIQNERLLELETNVEAVVIAIVQLDNSILWCGPNIMVFIIRLPKLPIEKIGTKTQYKTVYSLKKCLFPKRHSYTKPRGFVCSDLIGWQGNSMMTSLLIFGSCFLIGWHSHVT